MITELAKITNIPADQILGQSRMKQAVDARNLYYKLLRERGFSYPESAKLCDRTAATVLHGVRRVDGLLQVGDKTTIEMWDKIKEIRR